MKKLFVFTLYNEKGASSQYRVWMFKNYLDKEFDSSWFYFWDEKYVTKYMHNKKKYCIPIIFKYLLSTLKRLYQLLFFAPKADVVLIQKQSIPKVKMTFLKRLHKKGIRIVFDVDDAVYLSSRDNSSMIATISDAVICGNNNLYTYYSKYNNNVYIIPTVENTNLYKKYWRNTFDNKKIGWIGSKSTVSNLELVVSPINRIIKRHPEVSIDIISNEALDFVSRIKNSRLIVWDKDKYIEDLSKITLGIMPLYDNEFNRGKCGFKLIQYLNMKKPVVGSGVGINSEIINGNGMVVNTEIEWEKALEKILYNKSEYDKYVEKIEKNFFRKYSYEKVALEIIKILKNEK